MVTRRNSMRSQVRAEMRGGTGSVKITNLVDELPHGRLLAEITIPPGGSIGEHTHDEETEYYIITSGTGVVVDDGVEVDVSPGDVVTTGGGATHSIRASGQSPLVFIALIIIH